MLAGNVVSADTGQPVRRARVTAAGGTPRAVRAVQTDDQGAFRIAGLPPGEYRLLVTKDGYLESIFGQKVPGSDEPGTPIHLIAGQGVSRISLPLARGGVLTGTILDDTREPAIGVSVRVYRRVWRSGERAFQSAGTAMTDDRGVYRISALRPGDYLVSVTPGGIEVGDVVRVGMAYRDVVATLQSTGSANSEFQTTRPGRDEPAQSPDTPATGFAAVYYPNTTRAAEALSVPVAAGEERAGVDLRLRALMLVPLSGNVIGPDGPAAGAMVQLVDHAQVPGSGVRTAHAGVDGRFSFGAVPAGQYSLIARATPRGARPLEASAREAAEFLAAASDDLSRRSGEAAKAEAQAASIAAALAGAAQLWATADVLADAGKPSHIQMVLQPGLSISGRVVFEGASSPPASLTRMSLTVTPVGLPRMTSDAQAAPPAAVDASGRFTIRGVLPGRYTIAVAGGAPDGFVLRSAMFDGRDVLDIPFEIGPQDQPAAGIVTFTTRVSQLGGVVLDASGQPAFGVTVIVFPDDERLWTPVTRRIQAWRSASEGRYIFRNLPPGDYRLAVVADVEPGQWFDPAFLRSLSGFVSVRIAEGGTHTQELRVK
jgi:uncharacterized protein (DUF2141 family)